MTILEGNKRKNSSVSSNSNHQAQASNENPSGLESVAHRSHADTKNSNAGSVACESTVSLAGTFARERASNIMISSMVGDRYITPDYLAPLPSTEKGGKSPLQLLAQTCSQIGADSGSSNLLCHKLNGGKKEGSRSPSLDVGKNGSGGHDGTNRSPALIVSDQRDRTSPKMQAVNFKPYESDVQCKSTTSRSPSVMSTATPTKSNVGSQQKRSGDGKSPRVSPQSLCSPGASSPPSTSETVNPVIRGGMDVLPSLAAAYRLPAGMDSHQNPAFRSNFAMGGFSPSSMASGLTAAAAASTAAAGGMTVCIDPYCRDPTCPTAAYNAHLASITSGLPSGYAELVKAHQMAAAMAAAGSSTTAPTTTTSSSSTSISSTRERPYICNWMNGRDGYCGKRHGSAEELLNHLRTHTNLSTNDSMAAAAAAAMLSPSLYQLSGATTMHRPYGSTAALAAAAAAASARYHPYVKPGGLAGSPLASLSGLGGLGAAPPAAGLNGAANLLAAGLATGAYSPSSLYALYGSSLTGSSPSTLP